MKEKSMQPLAHWVGFYWGAIYKKGCVLEIYQKGLSLKQCFRFLHFRIFISNALRFLTSNLICVIREVEHCKTEWHWYLFNCQCSVFVESDLQKLLPCRPKRSFETGFCSKCFPRLRTKMAIALCNTQCSVFLLMVCKYTLLFFLWNRRPFQSLYVFSRYMTMSPFKWNSHRREWRLRRKKKA